MTTRVVLPERPRILYQGRQTYIIFPNGLLTTNIELLCFLETLDALVILFSKKIKAAISPNNDALT